ncbi:hypothetical protein BO86DRAFT_442129 [Aspergillus japonicus CBS 114.51]|uniref:FAD-binding FR-type domain-containing protein n=1 Tax=Aspergillus japonicus CBS 114.51 TaxID=1448312 RepID=A0A8T8WMC9_ASPJA|nr:hypothetical protein BO86DRAFT_442129 [Aspergillus japonicus CBS 114.51]RAH76937.1 hypothetical protein BO86DRAFT_442129 [Aspergillus japonicus CBS 114.51]
MKWSFLAVVFGLCSVVWASNLPTSKSQYCFYSIYKSLTSLTFETEATSSAHTHTSSKANRTSTSASHGASMARRGGRGGGASTTTKYEPYCEDTIEVTSIYASMKEYCSANEIVKGVAYWQVLCGKNQVDLINLTAIDTELTPQYLASLPAVAPDTYNTSVTVTSPVLLEKSYYKRYLRRLEATINATPTNIVYGWALIGYWGGVIVLGSLFNLSKASPWSLSRGPLATLRYYLRLHLVIPATVGTYHQRALYWCNIPKRLDSVIVFGFWAISIVLSCVNLGTFSGNPTTPDVSQQNWVYLSDRTAVLSYACLCWLWMFGGRNNIFLWSTGWSYGTFSVFHRHIALVATLEAVVHSIGYTVQWNVYSSDYIPALKDLYFVLGIVATIIMCLMILFAILPIRQRFYELFLLIHIAFAVVLLYCLYIHTAQIGAVYYSGYLWPPVAIWSFDRFLRLVRLVWCNVRVWYGHASRTQAVVHYSPASDVMRVDILNATVQGGPGQYYHLYQPMTLRGWENHPFTLGAFSTSTAASSPIATPGQVEDGLKPSTPQVQVTETGSASPPTSILTFWIRPYDGWTKRLRDQCRQQPGNTVHPTLLLEGPYGHRAPLRTYHTLIMIMGGTGIACAIPYLQDHLTRRRRQAPTSTVRIQLHWTVRQPAFVAELLQRELADILTSGDVQASFYCSRKGVVVEDERVPTVVDSANEKGTATGAKLVHSAAGTIHPGRAPIDQILAEAGAVAAAENTRVAVVSCGPAAMADQTRAAVHAALKQGCRTMDYFEEAYGW